MERLILSEGMSGFSIRAATSGTHQEDSHTYDASGKPVGGGDGGTELSSYSLVSEKATPSALDANSSTLEAYFGLSDTRIGNPGPSALLDGGAERLAAPLPLNVESQLVLNADFGDDEGVLNCDGTGAGAAAQAPETWEGKSGVTRNKDDLAVEDWLEAANALFETVADP